MLLYEYQVRDHIEKVRAYANNLKAKFEASAPSAELLMDAQNLKQMYDALNEMLPKEVRNVSYFGRHISWMNSNLKQDRAKSSIGDINDICGNDLKAIEDAFRAWCGKQDHYDAELQDAVSKLVIRHEFDSAVRKAFVILKERLVSVSGASAGQDGPELVNQIFGSKATNSPLPDPGERQSFRDLLAGLYGFFRNRFAHNDITPTFAEADGIIAIINLVLKKLGPSPKRR